MLYYESQTCFRIRAYYPWKIALRIQTYLGNGKLLEQIIEYL